MGCRAELLSCKDASAQCFGKGVSEDSIELLYFSRWTKTQKAFKIGYKQDFHDNFFRISHQKGRISLNTHV